MKLRDAKTPVYDNKEESLRKNGKGNKDCVGASRQLNSNHDDLGGYMSPVEGQELASGASEK